MQISESRARLARRFSLAVIAGTVALTGLVPAALADLRVDQNHRLTSDANPFRGKDQLALAVDPSNTRHIVATNANYLTEECEATTSFDGGATWSEASPLASPPAGIGLPFLPSCRISNHLGKSMFQTVAFGTGENVYATSITPRSTAGGEEGAAAILYKSTNGGLSWGSGIIAMPGGALGSPYYELPTLAVDPGAGPGGADRVYVAAHETTGFNNSVSPPCPAAVPPAVPRCPSVHVAVSNDGGATFAAPVQASAPGVPVAGPDSASDPVINPDHSVNIAWRTLGTNGIIQVARSTDAGVTWGAPVDVTNVTAGGHASNSHVTVLPSTGSSFPRLAGDPRNGNLYIVYGQGGAGPTAPVGGYLGSDHFIAPDSRVYFQRSFNQGATWSTPKRIDDTAPHPGTPTIQTRHPSVSVAPDGRVDIVWEYRRHCYQGRAGLARAAAGLPLESDGLDDACDLPAARGECQGSVAVRTPRRGRGRGRRHGGHWRARRDLRRGGTPRDLARSGNTCGHPWQRGPGGGLHTAAVYHRPRARAGSGWRVCRGAPSCVAAERSDYRLSRGCYRG